MKIIREIPLKRLLDRSPRVLTVMSALAVLWAMPVTAEETNKLTSTVAAAGTVGSSNQPPATALSPGIAEIVKMADAGVSAEIILTYVESSPSAAQPTDKDIIALKEHNVPDEVVKLLLKRSVMARTEAARAKSDAVMQVVETRRATSGGLDPESYDYFRAYYLQPRASSTANRQMYPYYGPYSPRGYTYGPVFTYGGHSAGRLGGYPVYRGGFR